MASTQRGRQLAKLMKKTDDAAKMLETLDVGTNATLQSKSMDKPVGYGVGAGNSATQGTSKATTVVLNGLSQKITMHNAALNAGVIVTFALTNTKITPEDHIIVTHHSGGTVGCYSCWGQAGDGTANITVKNISAGNLSEAIVLKVLVIKGVIT